MSTEQAIRSGALIGGAWGPGSAGTVEVRSPYSGEVVGHVAWCDGDDVDRAVAAAQAAMPAWAAMPAPARVRIVQRALALLHESADTVACMVATETGRTIARTRTEVLEAVSAARRRATDGLRTPPGTAPGVIGVISTCSAPADASVSMLAEALVYGGVLVWKPSEHAPTSCALLGALFVEAGVPDGVVNIVHGPSDVASAIAAHPDIDELRCAEFDTEPAAAHRDSGHAPGIAARLAARLAAEHERATWIDDLAPRWRVVLADADLDEAVEQAAHCCFHVAAQTTAATERILVHEKVHDAFVAKLRARAAALRIGDPADEQTDLGPMFDDETLQRLVDIVDDAWTRGAAVSQFGPSDGLFHPATILTEVVPDMRVAHANTYGPVAPIIKVSSAEEAATIARECGLARCAKVG